MVFRTYNRTELAGESSVKLVIVSPAYTYNLKLCARSGPAPSPSPFASVTDLMRPSTSLKRCVFLKHNCTTTLQCVARLPLHWKDAGKSPPCLSHIAQILQKSAMCCTSHDTQKKWPFPLNCSRGRRQHTGAGATRLVNQKRIQLEESTWRQEPAVINYLSSQCRQWIKCIPRLQSISLISTGWSSCFEEKSFRAKIIHSQKNETNQPNRWYWMPMCILFYLV